MQIPQFLSTAELAATLRVRPETVRHALCVRGDYMQIVPRKLPNGRLLWSAEDAAKLLRGESLEAPQKTAA